MKRLLYQELTHWQAASDRKPLILQGARQVGKTFLIKKFARETYQDYIYCNFEEDSALATLFEGHLGAEKLIERLSFYKNKRIKPGKTLIFFDEIQKAPRAITSLKYFNEQANEFHVIAAGSLLGVSIGQTSAFPVGKVNFLELYPLSFIEFLLAMGEEMLTALLLQKQDFAPLPDAIHQKLMDYFNIFLFIGALPEVVDSYATHKDMDKVQALLQNIHKSYANDFSKYASPHESLKISNIWQTIPSELAKENKKFKFGAIVQGARYASYELAIEWLRKAGLIYLSYNVQAAKIPIKTYITQNTFKLYYLDTGLLCSSLNASPKLIALHDSLYTEYKGALVENYIAKEIKPLFDEYLYYWTSKSNAEVDFIFEFNNNVFPLEVKSGYTKYKKSLLSFQQRYQPKFIMRTSPRNFTHDGQFVNIPLYAAGILKNLISQVD